MFHLGYYSLYTPHDTHITIKGAYSRFHFQNDFRIFIVYELKWKPMKIIVEIYAYGKNVH